MQASQFVGYSADSRVDAVLFCEKRFNEGSRVWKDICRQTMPTDGSSVQQGCICFCMAVRNKFIVLKAISLRAWGLLDVEEQFKVGHALLDLLEKPNASSRGPRWQCCHVGAVSRSCRAIIDGRGLRLVMSRAFGRMATTAMGLIPNIRQLTRLI
jgi:hypothetical protein